MSERLTLDVRFHVTKPQAIALMAMFDYWRQLGSMGASRTVTFVVDGDGDFHPACQYQTSEPVHVDDEMRTAAVVHDVGGDRMYDYDPVMGLIRRRREQAREGNSRDSGRPRASA